MELDEPWAFEFLAEDELLVTERKGRLLRVKLNDAPSVNEIAGLPQIATARVQTGLLDVALHPRFAKNRKIVFSYVSADQETGKYYFTTVAGATLSNDRLQDLYTILEAGPPGWSPSNFGGALEFLDDDTLLVSIGDRSEEMLAQRGDRLQGKILRIDMHGRAPSDNPFVGDPQVDDRIWALGLRNVQGLVRDGKTGSVYATSHGPMGGDEVNLIERGRNYGWPTITYGRNYTTARIGVGTHAPGFEQPLFYYLPSEAISPVTVYRGDLFSEWDGDLLVGALKGKHVSRIDLDGHTVRSEYPILREIDDRIRDIRVAHDGAVWILGQTTGLWRLGRDPEPPLPERPADGAMVYAMACAGCHDTGGGGAPRLDEGCRWDKLTSKGRQSLLDSVRQGTGNMPERGLCNLCQDRHLEAAVDFILASIGDCKVMQ
ncbi:MAG: PQQ-dependent sugar dehydrogenase [Xanthomonadales bacterium]|nr:PQQ-dependent sugar dehydrogenase [Xanthomonadales bacterium]